MGPVTAQGCFPPGANVGVAAPTNQISSAIGIFRILDMGCEPHTCGFPSLPFPLISSPPLSLLSYYFLPIPFPALEVNPLNTTRRSVERYKLPNGVWGGSPAEIEFDAFCLKIWHIIARNLKIFLGIKRPYFMYNFQISCRMWKRE